MPISGLGCAGGAIGLARPASIATAIPARAVLLLVVELCSLTFRCYDSSKSNIIASALFADGAAGVLLSCRGDGPIIAAAGDHTWPGSLDVMGWVPPQPSAACSFNSSGSVYCGRSGCGLASRVCR